MNLALNLHNCIYISLYTYRNTNKKVQRHTNADENNSCISIKYQHHGNNVITVDSDQIKQTVEVVMYILLLEETIVHQPQQYCTVTSQHVTKSQNSYKFTNIRENYFPY